MPAQVADNAGTKVLDLNIDGSNPGLSDRNITFVNSRVEAFNFYPIANAHLEVTDYVFGELNAFQNCDVSVQNSTCDGSGGYVLAADRARVRLTNSKIKCFVVSTAKAQMTLDNCQITGDITASGDASIDMTGCTHSGQSEQIGNGRIRKGHSP